MKKNHANLRLSETLASKTSPDFVLHIIKPKLYIRRWYQSFNERLLDISEFLSRHFPSNLHRWISLEDINIVESFLFSQNKNKLFLLVELGCNKFAYLCFRKYPRPYFGNNNLTVPFEFTFRKWNFCLILWFLLFIVFFFLIMRQKGAFCWSFFSCLKLCQATWGQCLLLKHSFV